MSILGNYLRARESAYFKVENEAQVQVHKQRLKSEGKLDDEEDQKNTSDSMEDSEKLYDVLAEVMAANTRIHDPTAARRREFDVRNFKGEAPPLTPEELRRYKTSLALSGGASTAMGIAHIPKVSLAGRNRYMIAMDAATSSNALAMQRQLSPQAMEVAQRSFAASMRSLAYGSLLAALLLVGTGYSGVKYVEQQGSNSMDSMEGVRVAVRDALEPLGAKAKGLAGSVKAKADVWLAGTGFHSTSKKDDGVFQSRLKERYNPSSTSSVQQPN